MKSSLVEARRVADQLTGSTRDLRPPTGSPQPITRSGPALQQGTRLDLVHLPSPISHPISPAVHPSSVTSDQSSIRLIRKIRSITDQLQEVMSRPGAPEWLRSGIDFEIGAALGGLPGLGLAVSHPCTPSAAIASWAGGAWRFSLVSRGWSWVEGGVIGERRDPMETGCSLESPVSSDFPQVHRPQLQPVGARLGPWLRASQRIAGQGQAGQAGSQIRIIPRQPASRSRWDSLASLDLPRLLLVACCLVAPCCISSPRFSGPVALDCPRFVPIRPMQCMCTGLSYVRAGPDRDSSFSARPITSHFRAKNTEKNTPTCTKPPDMAPHISHLDITHTLPNTTPNTTHATPPFAGKDALPY